MTELNNPNIQENQPRADKHKNNRKDHRNEPLSGSKKVKNRNHSNQNHGEGS